ncbi:MAG: DUF3306 domain-containing protein [Pseudomonadota bacterium]
MTGKPQKPGREGDFLSRWSERKRAGVADPEPLAEGVPETPPADAPEKTEEEMLAELGLPAPEELQPGDDFSGFMAKAVPERLRNRALRRLWLTNPVLANLDELVDYGEDFTDAATVIENLQTVYRVGKGMLPDPVPEAEDALQETAVAPEQTAGEVALSEADAVAHDADALASEAAEIDSTGADKVAEATSDIAGGEAAAAHRQAQAEEPTSPRRMRFRFET